MKRVLVIASLVATLGGNALAQARQSANRSKPQTQSAVASATEVESGKTKVSSTPTDTLLIPIIDSSPSVRIYWKEIRQAANDLIQGAPPQASVAIVGIDAEAVKSEIFDPSQRAEAMSFVKALKIGGTFTDLQRGSDAALALVQRATPSRCVLVYLTDGKLEVPKSFRNKSSFYDLLRREFTARPNITVLIVNVRGDKSAERETLPTNVKIFSLRSGNELGGIIESTLTPAIKQTLAAATTPAGGTGLSPGTSIATTSNKGFYLTAGLMAAALLTLVVVIRRRRRARSRQITEASTYTPANVMRQEDLSLPELITHAEPVALLSVEKVDERTSRRSSAGRNLIRSGERVVIGNSTFAEVTLEGLKQSQALQIGFDGETIRAYRLRPQGIAELDNVCLNQQPAPVQFDLSQEDELMVGDFLIRLTVTTEDAVPSSLVRKPTSHLNPNQNGAASRRFSNDSQTRSNYERANF